MCLGPGKPAAILGCTASAEALLADEASRKLVLVGADRFTIDGKTMSFAVPVDAEIDLSGRKAKGRLLSPAANPITDVDGFTAGKWNRQAVRPDSVLEWATEFAVT